MNLVKGWIGAQCLKAERIQSDRQCSWKQIIFFFFCQTLPYFGATVNRFHYSPALHFLGQSWKNVEKFLACLWKYGCESFAKRFEKTCTEHVTRHFVFKKRKRQFFPIKSAQRFRKKNFNALTLKLHSTFLLNCLNDLKSFGQWPLSISNSNIVR